MIKEIGAFILALAIFIGSLLALGTSLTRDSIQYNCKLDAKPSWHMAFWISTDVYDFAPEKFCADVRERMARGE